MTRWHVRSALVMGAVMLVSIFGFDNGIFVSWLLGAAANAVLDLCWLVVWVARHSERS